MDYPDIDFRANLILIFSPKFWLFEHWIHGSIFTAFTYSILAGVMIGRILGMRLKIKNILSEQSISIEQREMGESSVKKAFPWSGCSLMKCAKKYMFIISSTK